MPIDIRAIPVFCINLDKRPERFKKFSSQPGAKALLTNIQRFSAIDGAIIDPLKSDKIALQTKYNILHKTRRAHGEINTLGAIGCSLSHYGVWQKFLEGKADYCLVLEDDADVPVDLREQVIACTEGRHAFDVWALSYRLRGSLRELSGAWKVPEYYWGTSAYIISRAGAETLSKSFFPVECHMDKFFCLQSDLGYIRLVVHESINMWTLSYGSDVQMYKCDLCDFPDNLNGYIAVNRRHLYFGTAAAVAVAILSIFLLRTTIKHE